jgi:hypothetical protein
MKSLNENVHKYGQQVKQGNLKQAYQGLIDYIRRLRVYFQEEHQEYDVSGSVYQGVMDISFFSLTTEVLKEKDLKIAVVYIHEKTRFDIWLTGRNRMIQNKYHAVLKNVDFTKYTVSPIQKGVDSIVETVAIDNPNFDDQANLTRQIETEVYTFIQVLEKILN